MKYKVLSLALLLAVAGCSGQDSSLEASGLGDDAVQLIPATTKSCRLKRSMVDNPPETIPADDVTSAYFEIPQVNLKWTDDNRTMIITSIRLKLGAPLNISYVFSSGDLNALSIIWWTTGTAAIGKIPVEIGDGVTITPTNEIIWGCPLMMGGISLEGKKAFVASGTLDFMGYSVTAPDVNGNINKRVERLTEYISVENPFDDF